MKFVSKQKLNNIRNFLTLNHGVVSIDFVLKNVQYYVKGEKKWQIYFGEELIYIEENNQNLFIGDGEKSFILNSDSGQIIYKTDSENFNFRLHTSFSDKIIIQKQISLLKVFSGVYDLTNKEVLFLNEDNYAYTIFNNLIIGKNGSQIIKYSFDGKALWNFTLESLHQEYDLFSEKWNNPMEIANFCGVANEVLWMDVVCRGIGNFLLGLDVNTGQPIHLLDKAENRFMVYPFDMIPTDGRTTYDAKRNILFGFAPDWVHWQVDLSEKSPKIKMWDLSEEMTKHHAYVSAYMNCGISDSHIFFPVGSLGSTPQVFALNRETLKVDWQYHFTEGGQYFTPTKVEVTDTHLYVLDNTGTLHIFEKTEDN